jgi:hypothetical protein
MESESLGIRIYAERVLEKANASLKTLRQATSTAMLENSAAELITIERPAMLESSKNSRHLYRILCVATIGIYHVISVRRANALLFKKDSWLAKICSSIQATYVEKVAGNDDRSLQELCDQYFEKFDMAGMIRFDDEINFNVRTPYEALEVSIKACLPSQEFTELAIGDWTSLNEILAYPVSQLKLKPKAIEDKAFHKIFSAKLAQLSSSMSKKYQFYDKLHESKNNILALQQAQVWSSELSAAFSNALEDPALSRILSFTEETGRILSRNCFNYVQHLFTVNTSTDFRNFLSSFSKELTAAKVRNWQFGRNFGQFCELLGLEMTNPSLEQFPLYDDKVRSTVEKLSALINDHLEGLVECLRSNSLAWE